MKQFRVTVNGQIYDVTVEEIERNKTAAGNTNTQHSTPRKTVPLQSPPPAAVITEKNPVEVEGKNVVLAPMPGVIVNIPVSCGQSVKTGDVLLILEAMKMENEITSPATGIIKEIPVNQGAAVNTGDIMVVIE